MLDQLAIVLLIIGGIVFLTAYALGIRIKP
jgi:hypothetical protein